MIFKLLAKKNKNNAKKKHNYKKKKIIVRLKLKIILKTIKNWRTYKNSNNIIITKLQTHISNSVQKAQI